MPQHLRAKWSGLVEEAKRSGNSNACLRSMNGEAGGLLRQSVSTLASLLTAGSFPAILFPIAARSRHQR